MREADITVVASSHLIMLFFFYDFNEFCRHLDRLLRQVLLCVFYGNLISWGNLVTAVFNLPAAMPSILYISHDAKIKNKAKIKQPQADDWTSLRLCGIIDLKRLQKMKDHNSDQCKDVTARPDQMHFPEIHSIDEHKHKDKNRYDDDCYIKRCAKGRRTV